MTKTIYLFGEIHFGFSIASNRVWLEDFNHLLNAFSAEKLKQLTKGDKTEMRFWSRTLRRVAIQKEILEKSSAQLPVREKERLEHKTDKLISIVSEKRVRKIFLEWGLRLADSAKTKLQNVEIVVLREDPLHVKRLKYVSTSLNNIDQCLLKALSKHDSELKNRLSELSARLRSIKDRINAQRESNWIKQIDDEFVNPSLLYCGQGHICPVDFERQYSPLTGKVPQLLREVGYVPELVYAETEE